MNEKNNKYSGEMKPERNTTVEKEHDRRFEIQFTQNRSFELRIGRKTFLFGTGNRTHILNKKELDHPDFQQQARYFTVREV